MNRYEQKQEARRERYLERAAKAEREAASRFQAGRDAVAGIPFGQPILVGHHSERRHRAALKRQDDNMRKGVEACDKAEHYRRKAAGVGHAGISSDDPEAIEKLREKLASMRKSQELMKAANRIIRSKKLSDDEKVEKLAALGHGITEATAAELLEQPDFGQPGFASYQLSNNNANMKRVESRIAELERRAQEVEAAGGENVSRMVGDVEVVENFEENRIQLLFPGKPSAEVRGVLKRHGFRWSRYNMAWQRHLNNAGRYAADQALGQIQQEEA